VCKLLDSREEFETVLSRIERTMDNLEASKGEVKEILSDLPKYKEKVRRTLEVVKEKMK
jgi:prefoldin subunit 5